MTSDAWPVILIELVLVFGGVSLFAWWQLRSVARDRALAARQRALHGRDSPDPAPVDANATAAPGTPDASGPKPCP